MIPYLTGKDLKAIDERAESEYRITLVQLMEVAGTRMAEFIRSQVEDITKEKILVVCGKGNNGGDGLVMARVLFNWGADVSLFLGASWAEYNGAPRHNMESCVKLGVPFIPSLNDVQPTIIADCLFGFGFRGELREEHRKIVQFINDSNAKVFSCDLPSGMNAEAFDEDQLTVQADHTVTFTVPKVVLKNENALKRAGELYVLDIGIPKPLYEEMGVDHSFFEEQSWVLLKD